MIIQENPISCTQANIFIQKILPKFYAFINALLKKEKKNPISCIQTCIFIQIKNSYSIKFSCIYKCIFFSNSTKNQILCIQTCIFI